MRSDLRRQQRHQTIEQCIAARPRPRDCCHVEDLPAGVRPTATATASSSTTPRSSPNTRTEAAVEHAQRRGVQQQPDQPRRDRPDDQRRDEDCREGRAEVQRGPGLRRSGGGRRDCGANHCAANHAATQPISDSSSNTKPRITPTITDSASTASSAASTQPDLSEVHGACRQSVSTTAFKPAALALASAFSASSRESNGPARTRVRLPDGRLDDLHVALQAELLDLGRASHVPPRRRRRRRPARRSGHPRARCPASRRSAPAWRLPPPCLRAAPWRAPPPVLALTQAAAAARPPPWPSSRASAGTEALGPACWPAGRLLAAASAGLAGTPLRAATWRSPRPCSRPAAPAAWSAPARRPCAESRSGYRPASAAAASRTPAGSRSRRPSPARPRPSAGAARGARRGDRVGRFRRPGGRIGTRRCGAGRRTADPCGASGAKKRSGSARHTLAREMPAADSGPQPTCRAPSRGRPSFNTPPTV